ncbi:MAG: hypothetical protein LQ346_005275 [Caloplaca aetnensis]|nr:MAG: hypothetical protein LQ346_005275 [Caloplaca aetnensis]
MLQFFVPCLLIYLVAFRAAASPAPPGPSITRYRIDSLPNPLIVQWADDQYICTHPATWMSLATFEPLDCAGAIQKFYDIEVAPKRDTVYQFILNGTQQSHPTYYAQVTPRQYTHGAVIEFGKQYSPEDISTYGDIFSAVTQLHRICTATYGAPGWLTVGMYWCLDVPYS